MKRQVGVDKRSSDKKPGHLRKQSPGFKCAQIRESLQAIISCERLAPEDLPPTLKVVSQLLRGRQQ
jgi:hypothetical protein